MFLRLHLLESGTSVAVVDLRPSNLRTSGVFYERVNFYVHHASSGCFSLDRLLVQSSFSTTMAEKTNKLLGSWSTLTSSE
jgi:hypothetical protein